MTHKVTAKLDTDGTLTLDHLPFRAGDGVEVVVQSVAVPGTGAPDWPLRGSVVRYDHPTEPIGSDDWEAAS